MWFTSRSGLSSSGSPRTSDEPWATLLSPNCIAEYPVVVFHVVDERGPWGSVATVDVPRPATAGFPVGRRGLETPVEPGHRGYALVGEDLVDELEHVVE